MVLQVHSLNERFVTPAVQRTLWGLLGALCILLAAICTTVAGLQSIRLANRRQELAIRASFGASRWPLHRLLTVESLLLVALGMPFGLVVFEASRGVLLRLLRQTTCFVRFVADPNAESSKPRSMPILAITTSNSMSALPPLRQWAPGNPRQFLIFSRGLPFDSLFMA